MLPIYYTIWVCNLCLCWTLLKDHARIRSPHIFFWIGILTLYILPSISDPFIPVFKGSIFSIWFANKIETLICAQIIAFITLALFYILNKIFPIQPYKPKPESQNSKKELLAPILLIALTIIPILELIKNFGPLFFINFGFADRREGLTYLGQLLLSYNVLCATGIVYWAYSQNRKFIATLFATYYIVIFSLLGGSRQPIVAVFLPFFAFYIFNTRNKFLKLGGIIVIAQLFIALLAALLVIRNQNSINDRIDLLLNPIDLFDQTIDRPSDTAIRFAYYYYIENFKKIPEFGEFSYLLRTALFWLPTPIDVFNIKPSDFEYSMFRHYMPEQTGTMHPTYFGSIFADAGYLSPIWVLTTHCFHLLSTRLLNQQHSNLFSILVWSILGLCGIMMARGSLYAPVVITLFTFIYFQIAKFAINSNQLYFRNRYIKTYK